MTAQKDKFPGLLRLREYQKEAAHALATGRKRGVFAATGLGKTAMALAAWAYAPYTPVLILTRAIGRHAWVRDAAWLLGRNVSELWGGKRRSKSGRHKDGTFSDLAVALEASDGLVAANYEIVKARYKEFLRTPWKYIILDESHELKMGYYPAKKLESGGRKWRRFEYVASLTNACHDRGGKVWLLTATPVRDRIRDLWGQFHVADPVRYPLWGNNGRYKWLERYCAAHPGEYGGLDTTGSSNLDELKKTISRDYVVLTREQVADQMPAVQRELIEVEPNWKAGGVKLGGGIEGARDTAAAMKMDSALEKALEYLNAGLRVVLVTSRRRHAANLGNALGAACRKQLAPVKRRGLWLQTVTGATEVRTRMRVCAEFQAHAEGPAALVATMDSISTSMDLHYASGLIFVALPYTYLGVVQMEGRVGRLGGVPSTIIYLIAKKTIDKRIQALLLSKLSAVSDVGADTQGGGGATETLEGASDAEIMAGLRKWLNKV